MGLIDTHTHLESFARRGTLPAVLARARESGLETLVTIGTSVEDWSLYRELARAHPGLIRYTVGLHPCSVTASWPAELAQLDDFFRTAREEERPVALGEIGLDRFHLPKEPEAAERIWNWQREAFAEGLARARQWDCPVVIHSRGAFGDCVEQIDASGVDWRRVVFHCFTEGAPEIAALRARGGVGSFTGILTYQSAETVRQAAREQGLERLLLETDAPYLTPRPHRGKPNEPGFLRFTAEYAAELFQVPFDELAAVTTASARRFFGI